MDNLPSSIHITHIMQQFLPFNWHSFPPPTWHKTTLCLALVTAICLAHYPPFLWHYHHLLLGTFTAYILAHLLPCLGTFAAFILAHLLPLSWHISHLSHGTTTAPTLAPLLPLIWHNFCLSFGTPHCLTLGTIVCPFSLAQLTASHLLGTLYFTVFICIHTITSQSNQHAFKQV